MLLIKTQHLRGRRDISRKRSGALFLPGVRYDANGPGFLQNVREFSFFQVHVQRHENATGKQRPEVPHRPFGLIRRQQSDEVSRLHTCIHQLPGQGGCLSAQPRSRERHPTTPFHVAFQGNRVGKFRSCFFQEINQRIHTRFLPPLPARRLPAGRRSSSSLTPWSSPG